MVFHCCFPFCGLNYGAKNSLTRPQSKGYHAKMQQRYQRGLLSVPRDMFLPLFLFTKDDNRDGLWQTVPVQK